MVIHHISPNSNTDITKTNWRKIKCKAGCLVKEDFMLTFYNWRVAPGSGRWHHSTLKGSLKKHLNSPVSKLNGGSWVLSVVAAGTSLSKLKIFSLFNNVGSIIWYMPVKFYFLALLLAGARDQTQALEHVGKHSIVELYIPKQLSDILPRTLSFFFSTCILRSSDPSRLRPIWTSFGSKPLPL